jgi:hypothetical protein
VHRRLAPSIRLQPQAPWRYQARCPFLTTRASLDARYSGGVRTFLPLAPSQVASRQRKPAITRLTRLLKVYALPPKRSIFSNEMEN